MKVWTTLSENDIHEIANTVGVAIADRGTVFDHGKIDKVGRAFSFGLRPLKSLGKRDGDHKYQRTSSSGYSPDRRVFAVCWHGWRDFMVAIFNADPNARIKTVFADYKGRDNFYSNYQATGWKNVGSSMYPRAADEVCNCWKENW